MARMQIRGMVLYANGIPVPYAGVVIIDKDVTSWEDIFTGSSDDILWTGSTDAHGVFSGETAEWYDTEIFWGHNT